MEVLLWQIIKLSMKTRIKGTSRYKTHRIIMPDGSNFEFKNK